MSSCEPRNAKVEQGASPGFSAGDGGSVVSVLDRGDPGGVARLWHDLRALDLASSRRIPWGRCAHLRGSIIKTGTDFLLPRPHPRRRARRQPSRRRQLAGSGACSPIRCPPCSSPRSRRSRSRCCPRWPGSACPAPAPVRTCPADQRGRPRPRPPQRRHRRNNLGRVLQALGELPGARTQYERALQISEAALGPDHRQTRQVRRNLDDVV